MPKAHCPGCDAVVGVDRPRMGATVRCRECGIELEVVSTHPFEVDFPLDYGGGWDDEEWDDEEER